MARSWSCDLNQTFRRDRRARVAADRNRLLRIRIQELERTLADIGQK
jgi:hypothetical protein